MGRPYIPDSGPTFRPNFHEQKRAYEGQRDAADIEQTLQAALFPTKVAEAALGLTQLQQSVNSRTLQLQSAQKEIQDKDEHDLGYADQLDRMHRSGGTDNTPPEGASAAEKMGRMKALFDFRQSKVGDSLFSHDQMVKTNRLKEDAEAIVHSGKTSDEWNSDPELQAKSRFDLQFNGLRGHGLTDPQIHSLDIGNGTKVADLLSDPNNFTDRGTLRPDVFGTVTSTVAQALEAHKQSLAVDTEAKKAAARESTPADQQRTKDREAGAADKQTEDRLKLYHSTLGKVERETMSAEDKRKGFLKWQAQNFAPKGGAAAAADALIPGAAAPAGAAPAKNLSQAEYDALPVGATFMHNGQPFQKPAKK